MDVAVLLVGPVTRIYLYLTVCNRIYSHLSGS